MDVLYRLSYIGVERKTGLEPATLSLEGWCSTKWATSACYSFNRSCIFRFRSEQIRRANLHFYFNDCLLPTAYFFQSGERRIRTFEVVRQQIYSLSHLATLVSPQFTWQPGTERFTPLYPKSRWRDSNPRPTDYKSVALANWATSAQTIQEHPSKKGLQM